MAILAVKDIAGELAQRGLAYTHEDLTTMEVTHCKNGSTRVDVTVPDRTAAESHLWQMLDNAKTPEQILGAVVQLVVTAARSSQDVVPASRRLPEAPWGYRDSKGQLTALIDKLAKPVSRHMAPATTDATHPAQTDASEKEAR